jgi:hypothetical protein
VLCICECVFIQSINLLLNYIIRLCPLNPRFYGAQTNISPLKTTAYSYLHTTNISLNSTSIINIFIIFDITYVLFVSSVEQSSGLPYVL